MNLTTAALTELFERIPRRHSPENVKEIMAIISEYETLLIAIEGQNSYYEKHTATYFEDVEKVKGSVKKSTDNKASKKNKDDLFAEASGDLKESIESLTQMYGDGKKT
jgi:hypothetical protein